MMCEEGKALPHKKNGNKQILKAWQSENHHLTNIAITDSGENHQWLLKVRGEVFMRNRIHS